MSEIITTHDMDHSENLADTENFESDEVSNHEPHDSSPMPDLPAKEILADAGELLKALAAPVRIAIVLMLNVPRCVHEIVSTLEITQPLVSQHLRVLRAAGVVVGERRGREVMYRLSDHHLAHIITDAVSHVQE